MPTDEIVSFQINSLLEQGYFLFQNFFTQEELTPIRKICLEANSEWKIRFPDPNSVNSAYLTSPDFCKSKTDRESLFRFVSEIKILELAKNIIQEEVYFLNTQLFFNPGSPNKKNYWHRDLQYLGVSEEKQKEILKSSKVYHFRIPFDPDPGLEFIPGSQSRWDTDEEYKVRMEKDPHKNYEDLPSSVRILQEPGDLLVFSAHLIHRGIYGGSRHSFDILYTNFPDQKSNSDFFGQFPEEEILNKLDHPEIFRQET
ncbi:phytanoyl-CoA dioxygenase family protein [Leptospira sarikeiensis]|uniref:Deoxygenase n=1 Tax=Leptospira sarikeiensis TaxID=2484943 RepID=A0A4R9KDX4_9LEPT|nr:phytanoyl-CoA dioxygenase family protein [Leptospira sarikeiensis]TGL64155.1 deoxygenase [Leptospira sarikeiensis]